MDILEYNFRIFMNSDCSLTSKDFIQFTELFEEERLLNENNIDEFVQRSAFKLQDLDSSLIEYLRELTLKYKLYMELEQNATGKLWLDYMLVDTVSNKKCDPKTTIFNFLRNRVNEDGKYKFEDLEELTKVLDPSKSLEAVRTQDFTFFLKKIKSNFVPEKKELSHYLGQLEILLKYTEYDTQLKDSLLLISSFFDFRKFSKIKITYFQQ